MREIKFRAKSIDGYWVSGDLHLQCKYPHIHTAERRSVPIDPTTIGQFTGLTDKTGKEIYEGDILKWYKIGHSDHDVLEPPEDYIEECMDVVVFSVGAFTVEEEQYPDMAFICKECHYNETDLFNWVCNLDDFPGITTDDMYICEVVGNVHDNPDLIEKGGEE